MGKKHKIRVIATGKYLERHIMPRLADKYKYSPDIKWKITPHIEDCLGFPNIRFLYNQIGGGNFEAFYFKVTRV